MVPLACSRGWRCINAIRSCLYVARDPVRRAGAGAVRLGNRCRYGSRRVARYRGRGEGDADRCRDWHLRRQDVERRGELRVSGRQARSLCRDRREERVRHRARRERARAGWRPAPRGPADACRTGHGESRGDRVVATHRDRLEPARAGHHRRADPGPAAHFARVLLVGPADDRREDRRVIADDRQHAARRRAERQRAAQPLQQLPD